jgi:FdhE protein
MVSRDRGQDGGRQEDRVSEAVTDAMVRRPDPETIFRNRARRLRALAPAHPLEPFLTLVAGLAETQHAVMLRHDLSDEGPIDASCLRTADFRALLQAFLEHAEGRSAGEGPERVRFGVLQASWPERLLLAESVLAGDHLEIDPGGCFYLALALQAHLAPLAAAPRPNDAPSALARKCPRCSSRPFASVIVGGAAAGARFCCCALCGTQWRHLRAVCTWCGESQALYSCHVEGKADDVSAECCDVCGTYIKQFREDRCADLDPIADDLASFELDLTMESTPYVRRGLNPLMLFDHRSVT